MFARVTLEIALRKEFDYSIPDELKDQVLIGSRVRVPFGKREITGTVTDLVHKPAHPKTKPVYSIIGAPSLVTPKVIALARWIADYYCCAPETALKSVLPDSVRKESSGFKEQLCVHLKPEPKKAPRLTRRQEEILLHLRNKEGNDHLLQPLLKELSTTKDTLQRMESLGLLKIERMITERDPYADEEIVASQPLELNDDQAKCLTEITEALDQPPPKDIKKHKPTVFLLNGVTGSGKTEVYLQAIAHTLQQGKGAIVLVPEISLTPQTVERFKARFSEGPLKTEVAVLHSHLSAGEKHDEWHKIRQGRARIAIGARSAIFAPMEPLGLIIVDEEHEHSYKQAEAPRYHARDVAVVRGMMEAAVSVLGSATPSMESFYNAKNGKYRLIEMPERADNKKMPLIRVVDMRMDAKKKKGGPSPFSIILHEQILQRLERKEQTILFLNRRGYATSMQCPDCGFVAECPNCSVSLIYHRGEQILRCHICQFQRDAPKVCPESECHSPAIRYAGTGTQRVEEALMETYPHARIARMDSDALKRKEDYKRILGEFRTGKLDILLGTQMIAKGLHFPNVTLVGLIQADLSLHQADFRAGERTFQLITQVAGRAGRGDVEGEVIVQAFTPFHPAIQHARRQEYEPFYEQEIEFRNQLNYPPANHTVLLILRGRNEEKTELLADHLSDILEKELAPMIEKQQVSLHGPAPAPLARAETYYRFHLFLKTNRILPLSRRLNLISQNFKLDKDMYLAVDVDPVHMA